MNKFKCEEGIIIKRTRKVIKGGLVTDSGKEFKPNTTPANTTPPQPKPLPINKRVANRRK